MKHFYFLLFFVILVLSSIVSGQDISKNIKTTGFGKIPEEIENKGQARVMGRRAAIVDAYRKLAEKIETINLDSDTTVKKLIKRDSEAKKTIEGIIKGAQVIDERYAPNGKSVKVDLFVGETAMKELVRMSMELQKNNDDTAPPPHPITMEEWTEIVYKQWAEEKLENLPPPPPETPSTGIINGNFEQSNLKGWTLLGNAWKNNPAKYKDKKIEGNYFLASFVNGAQEQGTAISDPFTITKSKVVLWMGGGNHPAGKPGETTVNLIIDGEVIYSETGENDTNYRETVWDLGQYQGSVAQIKIIDASSEESGFIFVDNIRMLD